MKYYVANIPYSDELWHHGIKGQRWGIRRYTNEDGSLTELGLRRYGTVENYKKTIEQKRMDRERKQKVLRSASMARGRELYNSGYSHGKNIIKTIGKMTITTAVYGAGTLAARGLGMERIGTILTIAGAANNASLLTQSVRKAVDYERNAAYQTTYRKDKHRR